MVVTRRGQGDYGYQDTYRYDIPITSLAAGLAPPDAVTRAPYRAYAYTVNDNSLFTVPVPIDWARNPASTMDVYVRWVCNENFALATADIQWRIVYDTVDQNNQVLGAAATTATLDTGDVDIPVTALMIQETNIGTIIAANLAAVDTIGLELWRIASTTTPTAEPEAIAVWVEYTRFISTYQ